MHGERMPPGAAAVIGDAVDLRDASSGFGRHNTSLNCLDLQRFAALRLPGRRYRGTESEFILNQEGGGSEILGWLPKLNRLTSPSYAPSANTRPMEHETLKDLYIHELKEALSSNS
jgi:hypothetical protein